MDKINTSEHNEQATFIDAVSWQYRTDPTFIRKILFSVPNGAYLGGRSALQYAKLKKEGFQDGVSDLLYLQPRGKYAYLAIEMKTERRRREKRGGLSEDQVEFIEAVRLAGGRAEVCYGADEAIEEFASYMRLEPRAILTARFEFIR